MNGLSRLLLLTPRWCTSSDLVPREGEAPTHNLTCKHMHTMTCSLACCSSRDCMRRCCHCAEQKQFDSVICHNKAANNRLVIFQGFTVAAGGQTNSARVQGALPTTNHAYSSPTKSAYMPTCTCNTCMKPWAKTVSSIGGLEALSAPACATCVWQQCIDSYRR